MHQKESLVLLSFFCFFSPLSLVKGAKVNEGGRDEEKSVEKIFGE